jgi:probable rRNA maturation factor
MPDMELRDADSEPPPRSLRVDVTNETDAEVDGVRLEAGVRAALADLGSRQATISVAVVDDEAMHELNRRFLQHDYPTDVLSFTLEDDADRLEGEIIVSRDTAQRFAAEAGWSVEDELLLYVVHGALHLAGHRDKSPADEAAMRLAEATVLDRLGVVRSAGDVRWQSAANNDGIREAARS